MKTKKRRNARLRTKYFVPSIFILAILITVAIFPRQGEFKYSFSEGRPWQYGLLTAPFDFPIYKPADQLKQEQDSVLRYYEPYYSVDNNVVTNAMAEFDADINLDNKLSELPQETRLYIRSSLIDIYESGIMKTDDYDRVFGSETQALRLKEGNIAESKDIESFNTNRSAYKHIIDNIPEEMDASAVKAAKINRYIRENIIYDASTSEKARNEFIQQVSPSTGMIQTGERIISEGEIVSPITYQILSSLKKVTEERSGDTGSKAWMIVGQLIMTLLMYGSFYLYLLFFRPLEFRNRPHVIFMLLLITFFVVLTAFTITMGLFNVYIIPYAIVTILIRTFIDSRTALFASTITIILSSLMVPLAFEFIVIQLTVAIVSVFMLKELSERSQLIRSSFFILLTYTVTYLGLTLEQEGSLNNIDWINLILFLVNFIFIMFSYSLVYLMEKSFGFISGVSLVELSNINKPLLKELSEKAPGTFQHSMQVSNLAMEAALKIGANASLIRTGALYHDIGKMENPAFFTENQTPGMNPHAGLPFEESARIITNHVRDGVKIAQKHNLPKQIIDFIKTHHGTSMPKYFYISWKNANPGKEANEDMFRYPGPDPFTKEQAIMMMADIVEAASRSLQEYTEENITKLVHKLIDGLVDEGHMKMAPITFRDIETVKKVFIEKLKIIYHTRITYPTLNEDKEKKKE